MSQSDTPVGFLKNTDELIQQQALGAATSLIDYTSRGHCLIIGDASRALELVDQLSPLTATVLAPAKPNPERSVAKPEKLLTDTGVHVYQATLVSATGYLGAFNIQVADGDATRELGELRTTESGYFDLVLDLSDRPVIESRLPPFGYFWCADKTSLTAAMNQLPELIGEFDKPRYFDYKVDICAHARSNLTGCTNCIDVCVTDAISTSGDGVEINPYLCQGCGTCGTVCPTGAMTYAYPRPAQAIDRTREMLGSRTDSPVTLLLYAQTEDKAADQSFEQTLPTHVMPVAVEEVSAFGIDYWASMVCAGIEQIVVLVDDDPLNPNTVALQQQASLFGTIIGPLGFDPALVRCEMAESEALDVLLGGQPPMRASQKPVPHFATHNDKRQTFRAAIDQLVEQAGLQDRKFEPITDLPVGSPFGQIKVDVDACTLCMACVSVCPAGAVLDGQDVPKLRFIETNCVQCGICEQACPERAITLSPRYVVNSSEARQSVTLNEEEPFNCIRCHTPFATRKMIDNMTEKLSGHWMFGDDKATRRLKMCGDCRVMDMFEDGDKGINVHRDA